MKEINWHIMYMLIILIVGSWFGWFAYHRLTVLEYQLAAQQQNKSQPAIDACLKAGHLFHVWYDRFNNKNVNCKLKDPGPIFANWKDYKRYVREVKRAVGG